jgi:hypothetical protein
VNKSDVERGYHGYYEKEEHGEEASQTLQWHVGDAKYAREYERIVMHVVDEWMYVAPLVLQKERVD